MVEHFEAANTRQSDATVLGGFIHEAQQRDADFVRSAMDAAVEIRPSRMFCPIFRQGSGSMKTALRVFGVQSGMAPLKPGHSEYIPVAPLVMPLLRR